MACGVLCGPGSDPAERRESRAHARPNRRAVTKPNARLAKQGVHTLWTEDGRSPQGSPRVRNHVGGPTSRRACSHQLLATRRLRRRAGTTTTIHLRS
jgi:hypothetical protein